LARFSRPVQSTGQTSSSSLKAGPTRIRPELFLAGKTWRKNACASTKEQAAIFDERTIVAKQANGVELS
jgi:hypothetical protein